MVSKEAIVQRWDSFLEKIEIRFYESLDHAADACHEQLLETDYEYQTVLGSWMGIKSQIHALIEKIDTFWDTKVAPEMEAVEGLAFEEGNKAYDLRHKLLYALEGFERKLKGELSQKFYDHAIQIANKKASCTQCNADIVIIKDVFRAQYVSCTFCNTVNTVAPETKFQKIGWVIIDNIAALKTTTAFHRMNAAVHAISDHRGQAPESLWSAYELAHRTYWDRYFKERIALNSDLNERYVADTARKKKEFENYKEIQTK